MDHTDAVYQFVSPGVEFPTKAPPLSRAFGALHGSHSASFLPSSLSPPLSACLPACRTSRSRCQPFTPQIGFFFFAERQPGFSQWLLRTLSPPTVVPHSAIVRAPCCEKQRSGFPLKVSYFKRSFKKNKLELTVAMAACQRKFDRVRYTNSVAIRVTWPKTVSVLNPSNVNNPIT